MPALNDTILKLFARSRERTLSGEHIARYLGVSRAAVWKQIAHLRSCGIRIEGIRRKGYKLVSTAVGADLSAFSRKGFSVRYFDRIGSTQTHAKRLALEGVPAKTVVIARTQHAAYGRMQRRWVSPPGGLWFSLILRPDTPVSISPALTLLMGIAVAETIKRIDPRAGVAVKWPNDVNIGDRKLCGILTETHAEMDRLVWVVIGVGININNHIPPSLRKGAVSLADAIARPVAVADVLGQLLTVFSRKYTMFLSKGWMPFADEYRRLSSLQGRQVRVQAGTGRLDGTVLGIDDGGSLILQSGGKEHHLHSGEITRVFGN